MAARRWFAPGLLRQTAPGLAWHPVDLAQPDRASARGPALDASGCRGREALPPGRRVVALGEVDGVSRSGHPGDLPRGGE